MGNGVPPAASEQADGAGARGKRAVCATFNAARHDSPGSADRRRHGLAHRRHASMKARRVRRDQRAAHGRATTRRWRGFNAARRESPGSARNALRPPHRCVPASMRSGASRRDQGPLRSVLWRRQMRYRLRALYPERRVQTVSKSRRAPSASSRLSIVDPRYPLSASGADERHADLRRLGGAAVIPSAYSGRARHER